VSLYELNEVVAGYGGAPVLKGIGVALKRGEFIGIIGPNGAGKSTLLKVLTRAIKPESGSVRLKGAVLDEYSSASFAREVSVVHQFMENLLPFPVLEFIRMGRFPHQKLLAAESAHDREIVEYSIEATGITHLRDRTLTELSGGERQMVFIARALAQECGIIILDEPVSHLDIRHAVQIMDLLHGLNRAGTAIITVLHDINIASDYCSRIVALKDGRVFSDGPPSAIVTYGLIESLFDTVCVVFENPMTKKPYTFPVPEYVRKG
jgi:iron complex transport system ATP-binding protein